MIMKETGVFLAVIGCSLAGYVALLLTPDYFYEARFWSLQFRILRNKALIFRLQVSQFIRLHRIRFYLFANGIDVPPDNAMRRLFGKKLIDLCQVLGYIHAQISKSALSKRFKHRFRSIFRISIPNRRQHQ
jgi:hypothetical protein